MKKTFGSLDNFTPTHPIPLYVLCLVVFYLSGYTELDRGGVQCQTTPENPAYVLHHSSFTLPASGLKVYLVSHKKSSFQVPQNVKSFGNFRGSGAFFCFLRRSIGNQNPYIFVS